jgi:CheY-specific phosphatase CheX
MIDAIKEVINIISGGIKCRLNDQISGGITLSIPFFLDGKEAQEKNQGALIENIIISGRPLSLYMREQTS